MNAMCENCSHLDGWYCRIIRDDNNRQQYERRADGKLRTWCKECHREIEISLFGNRTLD